jgi:cathepsin B
MYKSLILAGVVAIGSTAVTHHINEDIVSEIKTKTEAWTPYEASENPWRNKSLTELNGLLGTIITGTKGYQVEEEVDMFGVPESFDARNQWKSCIHPIRNQAQCGSCWAFGSSEAFSDRACIASKGKVNTVFSAEDLVACDSSNFACNGGYLNKAWEYIEKEGLVTESCDPYTSGNGSVPSC